MSFDDTTSPFDFNFPTAPPVEDYTYDCSYNGSCNESGDPADVVVFLILLVGFLSCSACLAQCKLYQHQQP